MFSFETADQSVIRDTVAKLAAREIPQYQTPHYSNTVPRQLWNELATSGLAGLAVAPEYGGLGACPLTTIIALEELAAIDLGPAISISVHAMVAGLIEKFGSTALKTRYLSRLASGELLAAFALTEPGAGSDASALKSTFTEDAQGDYVVQGEKCYISAAGFADLYLVFARSPHTSGGAGVSAFLVEKEVAGLSISSPEKKMGCELSPIASLTFNGVKVSKASLLGEVGAGFKIALSGLAGGRINIAACANGISRSALHRATAHLKSRSQFGSVLAEFQGLQFMLADMSMLLESSQLLTWQAASLLKGAVTSTHSIRAAAAHAKCFATDSAMKITTDAVQLLGGAGYIVDYGVERLMREAKMLQIVEGTNQIQRLLIARELLT